MLIHAITPRYVNSLEQNNLDLNEQEQDNRDQCKDRTKKCCRGLLLTIIISHLWAGSLHLIKICYELGRKPVANQITTLADVATAAAAAAAAGATTTGGFSNGLSNPNDSTMTNHLPPGGYAISNNLTSIYSTGITESMRTAGPSLATGEQITFNAPFFIAWYCSMFNILFLPLYTFFKMFCFNTEKVTTKKIFLESIRHFLDRDFTTVQFFSRCGLFCALWTLANYLLVYTIRKLETTVAMALFACSVSLVYLLSWVFLHQQFVGIRVVAVIICDTGVALLAYMNHVDRATVFNVLMATAAAACAAVYKVFYKRIIGYTTFAQTSLFFTLVGFLNGFLMWPIVLLLYFAGAEILIWDQIPWTQLTGAAVLNLAANLLGNFGVIWTYEVFLTLGLLLAIPISSVVDANVYQIEFQGKKLSGIVLIMIGFLIVLLPDNWNEYLAQMLRSRLTKWKRKEAEKKKSQPREQREPDTTNTAQLSRLRTPSGRVK